MLVFRLCKEFIVSTYFYREYLIQAVARDLRKKYKRSTLGYLWSMLQPLLMMTILAVVFSELMGRGERNYAVFLFCGMLPWQYFDGTCAGSMGAVQSNAKIINQLPVPKVIFPTSVAIYNLVNFALSLIPLLLVIIVTEGHIPWTALMVPLVLIPLFLISMGCALLLSVLNMFFDDTQHLRGVIFRALYFLCPILYKREHLPDWLVQWVVLNPMFGVIENTRRIFYYGEFPIWDTYLWNIAGSLLFLMLGLWVFKKASDRFIYFL